MARRAKPNDSDAHGVTNLTEAKQVVAEEVKNILAREAKIAELSSANTASRKRVKTYGVPPAALAYAIKIKKMDPEDRQKHDEGCAIARDAIGLSIPRTLFEQLDERFETEDKIAATQKPNGAAPTGPKGDADLADDSPPDVSSALGAARKHLNAVPDAVTV